MCRPPPPSGSTTLTASALWLAGGAPFCAKPPPAAGAGAANIGATGDMMVWPTTSWVHSGCGMVIDGVPAGRLVSTSTRPVASTSTIAVPGMAVARASRSNSPSWNARSSSVTARVCSSSSACANSRSTSWSSPRAVASSAVSASSREMMKMRPVSSAEMARHGSTSSSASRSSLTRTLPAVFMPRSSWQARRP